MAGGRGCVKSLVVLLALARAALCLALPNEPVPAESLRAVMVTIDGIRLSEFESWNQRLVEWIDTAGTYVPFLRNRTRGVTDPNHALLWGCGDPGQCENREGHPDQPMHFELLRKQRGLPICATAIVTGKDHLIETDVCSDHPDYGYDYRASARLVVSPLPECLGYGFSYQGPDSLIMDEAVRFLGANDVVWMAINLSEYDYLAHGGALSCCSMDTLCYWERQREIYLEAETLILDVLRPFLESHPRYAGRTVLVVATDHGRHLDGVANGFLGHGHGRYAPDGGCALNCVGCRDIWAMFTGPGIRKGVTASAAYNLEDVAPTVRWLLGFENPFEAGVPIYEALESDPATAVPAVAGTPLRLRLEPNRPNPFPASTTVSFWTARSGSAEILVCDVRGRLVHRERRPELGPGVHTFFWDGRDGGGRNVPPGVYFYTVRAGDASETRKMIHLE